jgi:hypothetical protein
LAERGHNFQDALVASLATQKTPAKSPSKRDLHDHHEGSEGSKKRRHNAHAQRKGIEDFLAESSVTKSVYHNDNSKINKPFKVPEKVGRVGTKALFGTEHSSGKRPVLMDIVNDALGGIE